MTHLAPNERNEFASRIGGMLLGIAESAKPTGGALTKEEAQAVFDQLQWKEEPVTEIVAAVVEKIDPVRVYFRPLITIAKFREFDWHIEDVDWSDTATGVDFFRGDIEESEHIESENLPDHGVLLDFYKDGCAWADENLDVIDKSAKPVVVVKEPEAS